jgi:hypothetical protein
MGGLYVAHVTKKVRRSAVGVRLLREWVSAVEQNLFGKPANHAQRFAECTGCAAGRVNGAGASASLPGIDAAPEIGGFDATHDRTRMRPRRWIKDGAISRELPDYSASFVSIFK